MFKKQRIILLLLTYLVIPLQVFAYSDYILAGGQNIGIEISSKGILVVGTYNIGDFDPARNANLQIGDKIVAINKIPVNSISDMLRVITSLKDIDSVNVTYYRGSKKLETKLDLIIDDNNVYKTGLYVKDSINGVGTLTFIDPNTKIYGALGHEIIEKTTGQKLEIKDGKIYSSYVTGINPSKDGVPGEKNAKYNVDDVYGNIKENTSSGIFGIYTKDMPKTQLYKVSDKEDIKLGKASILTVINDDEIKSFDIEIVKVNLNSKESRNILFEVTDKNLLDVTGGIVQGMSGSPIIQNNNIVGAVTHVVVDDPTKGYGIFITNMLEEAEN